MDTPAGTSVSRAQRVIIYGAGSAGELVVEGLARLTKPRITPVAFVDDDASKIGLRLRGLPIESADGSIRAILDTYKAERVLIAMPSAPGKRIREIHKKLFDEGILAWIVPGIYSIVSSDDPITTFRDINPEDFLRRHPRVLEKKNVTAFLKGRRVLVTGAGGTIGSELVSQLAHFDLEALGCADQSELAIYHLNEAFSNNTGRIRPDVFLSDLSRPSDVDDVFERFHPTVVFHAAAYKHVRLLEQAARSAVLNNVGATLHLTRRAMESGVHTFVHVSTDKAIRPASVMGATKRVSEIIVQAAQARRTDRRFISVRFGNVLGSSGSVFPKFIEQIRNGGPVTVSDPQARRYFMLASEAVELVLWSAAVGEGGRIYLLDLGEPIRIGDLVDDLIRFFGRRAGRDIEIVQTGLMPGEKLFEDFSDVSTRRIDQHLLEVAGEAVDADAVESRAEQLLDAASAPAASGAPELSALLAQLVPDYQASDCQV